MNPSAALREDLERLKERNLPAHSRQQGIEAIAAAHNESPADLTDWLDGQGPPAALSQNQLIDNIVEIAHRRADIDIEAHDLRGDLPPRLIAHDLESFLQIDFPPREKMLGEWLFRQSICMIYAARGVGKTYVALNIAYAVASGGDYLGWDAPAPQGVLYLDGEMPGVMMQERLAEIGAYSGPIQAPLVIINPDQQSGSMPNLSTATGQSLVEEHITDEIKLIIIDNISTLTRGNENDGQQWEIMQAWILRLRARGFSVILVHHAGKTGAQRGTSKREDILDTVLNLKRPPSYDPSEGAKFQIHFEKARGTYGDAVEPIEAQLTTSETGNAGWTVGTVANSNYDIIVELARDGLSQREIAEE